MATHDTASPAPATKPSATTEDHEAEKALVAREAVGYVEDGMVVGIGSGTTMAYFVTELGKRVRDGLRIVGVPTSTTIAAQATAEGIALTTNVAPPYTDLTVDGTDQFDPRLRLIKGGGGDLLHEKIIASISRREVIIADSRKEVAVLGEDFPLPVEVVGFGWIAVAGELRTIGCDPVLRVDHATRAPFVTDEGNVILDCAFPAIPDPARVATQIRQIPGVVEHGLFLGFASEVIVAHGTDVQHLYPQPGSA